MTIDLLQEQFLREKSFEHYTDNTVLELLLETAKVDGDIPVIINNLYDTFGSMKGVLEARPEQLMNVPAVSKQAATLISMVAPLAKVWERCNIETPGALHGTSEAARYCKSLLMGERAEQFYVIALNCQGNIIGTKKIAEGTLTEVPVEAKKVAEIALNLNAFAVIICHNHPSGSLQPSSADIQTTVHIQSVLKALGIILVDHFIVSGCGAYSMMEHHDFDNGLLRKKKKKKKSAKKK